MAKKLEGRVIAKFKVLHEVGQGGFSTVYKVTPEDPNLEGVLFAMKVSNDKKHNPLLDAEAKILAKLDHPQIPRPIMSGECSEGKYLVMNFVPSNLSFVQPSNRFENEVSRVREVLEVLSYAHTQGVVHKDLKPKNIGLNKKGEPVLLDFNIAKELKDTINHKVDGVDNSCIDSDVVQVGDILKSVLGGTEGYKSPEQRKLPVDGKVHPVDQRSDLYTMGVILYERLVGHLPDGKFKSISEKDSKKPKWLDKIVDKALAQNPNDRYQNAREFIIDIEKGLKGGFEEEDLIESSNWWSFKSKVKPEKSKLRKATDLVKTVLKYTYGFGVPKAIWDRNIKIENWSVELFSYLGSGLATIGLWAATIYGAGIKINSDLDKRFVKDFEKDPTGIIVYERNGKLGFFKAEDALKGKVQFSEFSPRFDDIENLIATTDGRLYFTGLEDGNCSSLYEINLVNNSNRKIFDSNKKLDEICETHEKDVTESNTINISIDARKAVSLKLYELDNIDAKIRSLDIEETTEGRKFMLQIGNNWYSVNNSGEDFKKENFVVNTTNNDPEKLVCSHGTHRTTSRKGKVKLEWNGLSWGSYITPIDGTPRIWVDLKPSEKPEKLLPSRYDHK